MQNFANQCRDLARAILEANVGSIQEDGMIAPVEGDFVLTDEPGHAALAIGEYYRATQQEKLVNLDLLDLAARCITAQVFHPSSNGLAYAALALLSFGPSRDRNPVWARLHEATKAELGVRLAQPGDLTHTHEHAFDIAKAVARASMDLERKDQTGTLLDNFLEVVQKTSSSGFADDEASVGLGGVFDIFGLMSAVFIRQALQLHANHMLRERKLPVLRSYSDKYLKLLPDMVRSDGLGFAYGRGIGAYGQMHCISLVLQSLRDGWITEDQKPLYLDILRRLFQFFFGTYVDQEHGFLVIRDEQRSAASRHSMRLANFDAARYLSQWARLAQSVGGAMDQKPPTRARSTGRFVLMDKSSRKEQGVFLYQDAASGLQITLPLVGSGEPGQSSGSLTFPHAPGVFDWPVGTYAPIMQPELTFGEHVILPSFYGVRCTTGLGNKNAFFFRYEQPELISKEEKIIPGLGSCKVCWTFAGEEIISEYIFIVKSQVELTRMRYTLALAFPHSAYTVGSSFALGPDSLRATVQKDDFHAAWADTEVVSEDPAYRTYWGKIHYLQHLERQHPLIMRPGQQYKLVVSFKPDVTLAGVVG